MSQVKTKEPGSKVFMVATPIGNRGDLSPRAIETLSNVDIIACEDTRHTLGLLKQHGISKRLVSLHEHNEYQDCERLVSQIQELGQSLAYVSDAGTPGVSDPGAHLAAAAHLLGVPVFAVAGPSALAAALSVCGFRSDISIFSGFFPRKTSERDALLKKVRGMAPCQFVFFESPHRMSSTLSFLQERMAGETPVCVCRELTKIYETTCVSPLSEALVRLKESPERGEFVVVLAVAEETAGGSSESVDLEQLAHQALGLSAQGASLKEAARRVVSGHPTFSSRDVYQEALRLSAASASAFDSASQETYGRSDASGSREVTVATELDAAKDLATLSRRVLGDSESLLKAQHVLSQWFESKVHRRSVVTIDPQDPSAWVQLWCAQVYKRGIRASFGSETLQPQMPLTDRDSRAWASPLASLSEMTSKELRDRVTSEISGGRGLCVLDAGFAECWPEWQRWSQDHAKDCVVFAPSEHDKNLEMIATWSQRITPERRVIWAVGGGITSDMAGFLAGLFRLRFHCSPTTLLAACDAAIGGKTAVNFLPFGKNQLGLFHPPQVLAVAAEHFGTLDRVSVLCGLAETLKHLWLVGTGAVESPEVHKAMTSVSDLLFRFQEEGSGNAWSPEALQCFHLLVAFNLKVKSAFVARDPLEQGLRRALNFGHTLGHALEGLGESGHLQKLDHGIAVAIGMLFVLRSLPQSAEADRFQKLLDALVLQSGITLPLVPSVPLSSGVAGVPNGPSSFAQALVALLAGDKKRQDAGEAVPFVVPNFGQFASLLDQSLDTSGALSTPRASVPAAVAAGKVSEGSDSLPESCPVQMFEGDEILELCQRNGIFRL